MSEKLKELLDKIHDKKNDIPEYITIKIREAKNLIDIKIRKLESNILKILAHEEEKKGWYLHSYHIPLKNLGLPEKAKNKNILPYLNQPRKIMSDKPSKELVEEILQKYIEIHAERKKHYFRTERFSPVKDYGSGPKMKAF
jgi:hypothetical protein